MTRVRRFFVIGALAVAAIAVAIFVALAIDVRVETGQWRMPDERDLVRVAHRVGRVPSKTIYLERQSIELHPGEDDAAGARSSVLADAANKPVKLRGFSGSHAAWQQLVQCVEREFAPFDVTVTERRPGGDDFIMVAVGGYPADIGVHDRQVAGLAPFNGGVIPRAVVFAFSAATNNDVRETCETIAMEVAHVYGLDHEYLCHDVMTYLAGCEPKMFVDADAPCGEKKKRPCESGGATQNSFRRLVDVLGARVPGR